jgi:uncharacterized membrane protein YdjX (TVP38/TMEM64 family)
MPPRTSQTVRDLLLPIVLVAVVLAIPILPLLLLGDSLERELEGWLDAQWSPAQVAAAVVALLAVDVFLPVPSSVVSTFGGNVLGFWVGTAASWLGMMVGASLAFALARWFGRRLALWLSSARQLDRIDALSERYGPLVLVLARSVPVMAEASVLLLGTSGLSWRRFLVPMVLSNLGLAAVYAALGDRVRLPVALAAAVALPLLASTIAGRLWPTKRV